MTTVKQLYSAMNEICPFGIKDPRDNSGLIVGSMNDVADKVLVCLDITADVAREAVENGYNAVVSHHPVIFNPLYSLNEDEPSCILFKNGISAICAHSNLDMARGGINDIIAEMLGFEITDEVLEYVHNIDGEDYGYGKICTTDIPYSADELAALFCNIFGCKVVRYNDSGKKIQRLAFCSGSGSGNLELAKEMGADALLTGDVKHDRFVTAGNIGVSLFDAGHYHTENICVKYLQEKLSQLLPEAKIHVSSAGTDVCKYLISEK